MCLDQPPHLRLSPQSQYAHPAHPDHPQMRYQTHDVVRGAAGSAGSNESGVVQQKGMEGVAGPPAAHQALLPVIMNTFVYRRTCHEMLVHKHRQQ